MTGLEPEHLKKKANCVITTTFPNKHATDRTNSSIET